MKSDKYSCYFRVTVAQLVDLIAIQMADYLSLQAVDQLRLDISHVKDHLPKSPVRRTKFAVDAIEPLIILLKVIGAYLSKREREEVATADLESNAPSPLSRCNNPGGVMPDDSPHESIWLSFLENLQGAHVHLRPLQLILLPSSSVFARLVHRDGFRAWPWIPKDEVNLQKQRLYHLSGAACNSFLLVWCRLELYHCCWEMWQSNRFQPSLLRNVSCLISSCPRSQCALDRMGAIVSFQMRAVRMGEEYWG